MTGPVGFPMDGPHTPETIRDAADLAAEAIRYLNRATNGPGGLEYPGDVYTLLGALYMGTQRLPQLLGQLTGFLAAQGASGRLGDDQGRDVAALIADASYRLGHAHGAASALTTALQQAQNAIAGLYAKNGTEGSGDDA